MQWHRDKDKETQDMINAAMGIEEDAINAFIYDEAYDPEDWYGTDQASEFYRIDIDEAEWEGTGW